MAVDNDEILCSWTTPPLSSIIPDAHRSGFEAARILSELMARKNVLKREIRYPPLGIVSRENHPILWRFRTAMLPSR